MEAIQIICPKCGRGLKLKDRSLIGRRGRCPSCDHGFVLRESAEAEVQLELASDAEAVPVGTAAQWVPDDGPLPPPPDVRAATHAGVSPLADLATIDPAPGSARSRTRRRKTSATRRNSAIIAGAVTAAVVFGGFLYLKSKTAPTLGVSTLGSGNVTAGSAVPNAPAVEPVSLNASDLQSNAELVESVRPTHGEPIQLYFMPSGVNFLIHLRPADLWGDEPAFQELRATLTQNVTDWIAAKLQETCRREPAQIEEALIGIMLGARGTEPELATVVRLKEPAKLSDLIEEFHGEPIREDAGLRLYRSGEYAYLIHDPQTIAICPASMGGELAEWTTIPNDNTTDGLLQLLHHTDRDRLFTVLFEVDDVRRHEEWLFPASTLSAFRHALDAVSDDAESVCWSIHLNEKLHSDLFFRTRVAGAQQIMSPKKLAESLTARMEAVPQDLVSMVRRMEPPRAGARTLIGRLPAMAEAYRQSTLPTTGERYARLTTVLPRKAAPNLALATMLTWDEARRTDFSTSVAPTVVASNQQTLPETVAERLNLPVVAEFNRTPLRDAFQYICDKMQVTLDLDGDALKDAAYTQNMPQTFALGEVSAADAIHGIIDKYDGMGKDELRMAVCIDEQVKSLIVTTKKFAEQRGLTPVLIAPPKEPAT